MKIDKRTIASRRVSRRQFLVGPASVLLLPPLLSLRSKNALAGNGDRVVRVVLVPALYGMDPRDFFPNIQYGGSVVVPNQIYTTPLSQVPNGMSTALGSAFDGSVLRTKM